MFHLKVMLETFTCQLVYDDSREDKKLVGDNHYRFIYEICQGIKIVVFIWWIVSNSYYLKFINFYDLSKY